MKFALIALMCIVPWKPNFTLQEVVAQQKYIEEEGLELVYLSCYLPTGNRTADGSIPYEGVVSSNREHLGQDCIVFDQDLNAVMRLECRDIGGNSMLVAGTAIDIFVPTMERAYEIKARYGDYVYVRWVDRNEGKDEETVSGN